MNNIHRFKKVFQEILYLYGMITTCYYSIYEFAHNETYSLIISFENIKNIYHGHDKN